MISPSKQQDQPKIGVFGHVGNNNLGDEAIIAAVIQNIRERIPDASIVGYTINPVDTNERHGIPAFPIRRTIEKRPNAKSTVALSYNTKLVIARNQSSLLQLKTWIKSKPRCYEYLRWIRGAVNALLGIPGEIAFLIQCYRNLKGVQLLIVAGSANKA